MKAASAGMIALLKTGSFFLSDLYTITLVDGVTVFRFTGGDKDIVYNGNTYSAGGQIGPYFERKGSRQGMIHWTKGLQVDNLVLDIMPGSYTYNGIGLLSAMRQGFFDGAVLQLDRAIMPTYGDTSNGVILMFLGRVAEIDFGRSVATVTIKAFTELLNQNVPRNLYQSNCLNTLYDTSCTLLKANFSTSTTSASGSTASTINATLAAATGYYDLGMIKFTSGKNIGLQRTVKTYTNGSPSTVALISPFPNVPTIGDAFTIYPGCDKTSNTCTNKFGNLVNFRGQSYIPQPESVI